MSKKILFKITSRERKNQLLSVVDSILANLSEWSNCYFLFSFDADDKEYLDKDFIDHLKRFGNAEVYHGISNSKIEAINRDISLCKFDWDIICNISDDMPIVKPYFDYIIRQEYNDGFTGLLHTPDGLQNERLCTFAIMDRNYYELDGWIYQPKFLSVFADNFQHQLAVKRDKYKYLNNQLVVHKHYRNGFGEPDELMQRNDSMVMYAIDKATYEELIKEYNLV